MARVHQLSEPPGGPAVETSTLIGRRGTVRQARVLGLCRHGNQIGVSKLPSRFEFGLNWDCAYEHLAERMTHGMAKE